MVQQEASPGLGGRRRSAWRGWGGSTRTRTREAQHRLGWGGGTYTPRGSSLSVSPSTSGGRRRVCGSTAWPHCPWPDGHPGTGAGGTRPCLPPCPRSAPAAGPAWRWLPGPWGASRPACRPILYHFYLSPLIFHKNIANFTCCPFSVVIKTLLCDQNIFFRFWSLYSVLWKFMASTWNHPDLNAS